ncbi:MAG TPA: cytochrome c biogenesis protein ResB [Euzebyales bacterium]|nr:cytochrome c biogenesis protein ResB [Euzebyales bacterium]
MAETRTRANRPSAQEPRSGWARLPMIPGPWETLVIAWRRLRRMSTALLLLFSLAIASIVATFIPQEPLVPDTVARWRTGAAGPGRAVARLLDGAGVFDVFSSWWFTTLTVLLLVSLTGCLLPRYLAFWRTARRPPATGRSLDRLTNHALLTTSEAPDAALDRIDRILGRCRFGRRRVPADDAPSGHAQLAAEKGHWREGGNLVFHSAFYVLFIGVAVAQTFGFTGQINVVEGGTFTDTRIVYGNVRAGRWFGIDEHRGFQVRLDDFDATYHANGTPDDFVSTVTVLDEGAVAREGATVRVNAPLRYDGMKLYQLRFGMAPRVVVRAGDTVLFDDSVMMADNGGVWTGTAKVKTSGADQIALDLALLPDFALDGRGRPVSRSPQPDNPVLFADLWVGELGLERSVDASQFIRDGEPVAGATLTPGDTSDPLLGNLTVEFAELPMWSGFQVSHAPGRWTMLVGCVALLIGLVASLYGYRRRVWAEAWREADGTTRVVLAGVALQRKVEFAGAFEALVADVRAALPTAGQRQAQETTMTDAHHG